MLAWCRVSAQGAKYSRPVLVTEVRAGSAKVIKFRLRAPNQKRGYIKARHELLPHYVKVRPDIPLCALFMSIHPDFVPSCHFTPFRVCNAVTGILHRHFYLTCLNCRLFSMIWPRLAAGDASMTKCAWSCCFLLLASFHLFHFELDCVNAHL